MNQRVIRSLDAWLGTVLCCLLTLWRHLIDAVTRRASAATLPPRRVLFLKLIEQGATVLAVPALSRAVHRFGRENVYLCVFEENRAIADILALLPPENVLVLRHHGLLTFAVDVWRFLRETRRLRIDTVIDFEFMARAPAVLSYLSGASSRVGLHRFTAEAPYRGDLMTHRVQYNPYLHTSVAYDLLVRALDEDPGDIPLLKVEPDALSGKASRFRPSETDLSKVQSLLDQLSPGWRGRKLVLLNPNTGDLLPVRMWPTDRFVALGKQLLTRHENVLLLITGAPSERAAAEEVCHHIGSERAVSVAGKTSLRDVIVLYGMAQVLVTNDSGPGHFASLTDIHNIVLFGPETPALFGPIRGNPRVLWRGLACSPCVNPYNHRSTSCSNNVCMQSIQVEHVLHAVEAALAACNPAEERSRP